MSTAASSTRTVFRRVLVTGGNKGIGRAICEQLLEQYPDVHVFLSARNEARGQTAVQEIVAHNSAAKSRIEFLLMDTSSDESVQAAAKKMANQFSASEETLYGIVNNAGIFSDSYKDTLEVNYFGPQRVAKSFLPLLQKPGGRIVNVSSASGPMFVSGCTDRSLKAKLANPVTIAGGITEVDEIARSYFGLPPDSQEPYFLSKALLNSYTILLAKEHPQLVINACTPGFIDTDMSRSNGLGATNPPVVGTKAPVYLLMDAEVATLPTGRYYGSDAVRSPLDRYRGPGDPPHEGEP